MFLNTDFEIYGSSIGGVQSGMWRYAMLMMTIMMTTMNNKEIKKYQSHRSRSENDNARDKEIMKR